MTKKPKNKPRASAPRKPSTRKAAADTLRAPLPAPEPTLIQRINAWIREFF